MFIGASSVTAAAVIFLGLGLSHLGRRGGPISAAILSTTMVASVAAPIIARGPGPSTAHAGCGCTGKRSCGVHSRREHADADARRRVARGDLFRGGRRPPAEHRPHCRQGRRAAPGDASANPGRTGVERDRHRTLSDVQRRPFGGRLSSARRHADPTAARLLLHAGARDVRLSQRAAANAQRPAGAADLEHPERSRRERRRDRLAVDATRACRQRLRRQRCVSPAARRGTRSRPDARIVAARSARRSDRGAPNAGGSGSGDAGNGDGCARAGERLRRAQRSCADRRRSRASATARTRSGHRRLVCLPFVSPASTPSGIDSCATRIRRRLAMCPRPSAKSSAAC